ncbi:MAG: HAMP domain-containing sensor histidine kinase [Anaerolineales bacterium]|nr:HAMP domain-containing sensor histidine kinase [Anaerolineales bacterium]
MNRRQKIAFGIACVPALIGLGAWLAYFQLGWLEDYIVFLRLSLGYIILAAGLALSGFLVAGVFLVIWQERKAAKAIQQSQLDSAASHRQFLLRLDHELKNPLTTLQVEVANLDSAHAALSDEVEQEHSASTQRVKEQVARLNDLVIQLRKLAEIETRPLEDEPVDLDGLLNDLITEFQLSPAGMARTITLNAPQIPWRLPEVRGDADLLYLALHNVMGNAVKYTRPGDTIQARAFEDGRQVIVEIVDTGPGMPEEEQAHVWEELYRGNSARGTPGSGLGLTLVKTIIERHAGQVAFRSRVNQGTIVTIRLPSDS